MARKKKAPVVTKTETIEEYLARGGKITVCEPYERSDPELLKPKWGRGRKKKSTGEGAAPAGK